MLAVSISRQSCKNYFWLGFRKCVHLSSYPTEKEVKKNLTNVSSLFKPLPVSHRPFEINVGSELVGKLDKTEILKILNKFTQKTEVKMLCVENGLDCK